MIRYLIKGDSTVIFILCIILILYNRFRNNSNESNMNANGGNFDVDSTEV